MKKHITTATLYTAITAILLGIVYPLAITAIARICFPEKASGELIYDGSGNLIGSKLIGQGFASAKYFHSRPSAAGTGYDASSSSGSNLGPTSQALVDRVHQSVLAESAVGAPPIDLVTASGSGLDPDITPAAAFYQVARIASLRGMSEGQLRSMVAAHSTARQFGLLGEPRVNVLELNLALDRAASERQ